MFTVEEVAERYGTTAKTVLLWIKSGEGDNHHGMDEEYDTVSRLIGGSHDENAEMENARRLGVFDVGIDGTGRRTAPLTANEETEQWPVTLDYRQIADI
jgi:hypothetical protein